MEKIQLLDIPQIPEELIDPLESIPSLTPIASRIQHRKINEKLKTFVDNLFKVPVVAEYLVLDKGISPHKDRTGRLYGYNYILNTGGERAVTTVYDQDLNVVDEVICKKHCWYKLPANEWHSIHGVEPGDPRIVLTVTIISEIVNREPTDPAMYPGINPNEWFTAYS